MARAILMSHPVRREPVHPRHSAPRYSRTARCRVHGRAGGENGTVPVPAVLPAVPSAVLPAVPSAVPTGPGFDVVLLLHVAAAVVALGSVAVAGVQARRVLAAGPAGLPPALAGFYAPGVNWVGRTLHAVPLLGLALVGLSRGAYGFDDAWIQWGIGLWVVAAVGAEAVLWPAERRIQATLARPGAGVVPGAGAAPAVPGAGAVPEIPAHLGGPGGGPSAAAGHCRTAFLAAAVLVAVLLAAIVVMVAQP
jgi:hypothetical protein